MKTASSGLAAHLQGEVTRLASLWEITREDGQQFFFTDHDRDIVFDSGDGSNTYVSSQGYDRTATSENDQLSPANMEITGFFSLTGISREELESGLFSYASVKIFVVNWGDLTQGAIKFLRGRLGEVTTTRNGAFKTELRGLAQQLSQNILELTSPICRADVGDSRCKVPIQPDLRLDSTAYSLGDFIRVATDTGASGQAQYENVIYECTTAGTSDSSEPTFDTTPGNTTTDGTAVFTAREAWSRDAVVASVTDRQVFTVTVTESRAVDDWFNAGGAIFESGDNAGETMEIRDWEQSTSTLTMFLPLRFTPQVGDRLRLYPGCDKLLPTCKTKWAISGSVNFSNGNVINRRAEDYLPGERVVGQLPDAH